MSMLPDNLNHILDDMKSKIVEQGVKDFISAADTPEFQAEWENLRKFVVPGMMERERVTQYEHIWFATQALREKENIEVRAYKSGETDVFKDGLLVHEEPVASVGFPSVIRALKWIIREYATV